MRTISCSTYRSIRGLPGLRRAFEPSNLWAISQRHPATLRRERTTHRLFYSSNFLTTRDRRPCELIADGKVPSARLVLQRAASAGSAPAALELGGTYDPIILERLGVTAKTEMIESTVISPDTALARAWYQKAKDLGSVDAPGRLEKLARRSGRPR